MSGLKINRLFKVLVVGGSMIATAACGSVPEKPSEIPTAPPTAPSTAPSTAPAPTDAAPEKDSASSEEKKKDGVCSWL